MSAKGATTMRLIKNDLGLITTANGQWCIKQESPELFIVRERTGPEVWDWADRARAHSLPAASTKLLQLLGLR